MNCSVSHLMRVHLPGGNTMDFKEIPNGLLCHDIRHRSIKNSEPVSDYFFVTTVEENKNTRG